MFPLLAFAPSFRVILEGMIHWRADQDRRGDSRAGSALVRLSYLSQRLVGQCAEAHTVLLPQRSDEQATSRWRWLAGLSEPRKCEHSPYNLLHGVACLSANWQTACSQMPSGTRTVAVATLKAGPESAAAAVPVLRCESQGGVPQQRGGAGGGPHAGSCRTCACWWQAAAAASAAAPSTRC